DITSYHSQTFNERQNHHSIPQYRERMLENLSLFLPQSWGAGGQKFSLKLILGRVKGWGKNLPSNLS
ncbi:MAG: hypothetical protein ACKO5Q_08580, partial [Microcystaceae cyanobacterium]